MAGKYLVIDETMIWWTGLSSGHLTFLPRKPTPLGFQLKTVVDGSSGVLLALEIVEGKEVDSAKKHVRELGQTCATTLRVLEPFYSKGHVLIGDSWFGSLKTCVELRARGVFSVMNVKIATKGFPKNRLREGVVEREAAKHMKVYIK